MRGLCRMSTWLDWMEFWLESAIFTIYLLGLKTLIPCPSSPFQGMPGAVGAVSKYWDRIIWHLVDGIWRLENVVQSTSLFWDTYIVFGTVDIFVISQPKWLKFGVQAHLFKMIGHTNFQLSISCTFKVMKLLVEVKVEQNFYKNWKNSNFLQISDMIWVSQSLLLCLH